jgi:hypothetical protein
MIIDFIDLCQFPPRSLRSWPKIEEIAQWVERGMASDALVIE